MQRKGVQCREDDIRQARLPQEVLLLQGVRESPGQFQRQGCTRWYELVESYLSWLKDCAFRSGEIVCKQCYAKNYSCQANPLSGADMLKLLDTSLIKGREDKDGKVEGCPRCQGQVGFAWLARSFAARLDRDL